MKLGIVIPLKSKRVSRDWESISACLEETLRSLVNQTSGQWVAVVVGHEKPDIDMRYLSGKTSWIECARELPLVREGGSFTKSADFDYILDKCRKIGIGMHHLEASESVTDWFVLDADDLVHCDFVRTLERLPSRAGWVIRSGYLWYRDVWRWMPSDQLLNLCGSTAVISASCFDVPSTDQDDELGKIPWCRMSHSDIEGFLTPQMNGADPTFPLAAIAYTLSHGDNCSDEFRTSMKARLKLWIKKKVFTRRVTSQFAKNFGIATKRG